MAKEKESKHKKYNEKRGATPIRVQLVPSDDVKLWEQIKADLNGKSGNVKAGIVELYQFAKKHGYFK